LHHTFLQRQRKTILRKSLLFLLPVLLFGMVLVSCNAKSNQTSQSIQSTQNSIAHIKEWVQVGDYGIFVHQIIQEPDIVDGKHFVNIEVEYANNRSVKQLSCRSNQWNLYDSQGYSYEAESSSNLYENKGLQYLGDDRFVNQNMQLRGWLVFKVPESATIKRIQFITAFIGTKTVDIIIDGSK